ncbi:MAG: transglycosylase SLT domain-containing protein [Gammaproteobacteria bacterium]|nr:transglycosylase SLT domain-containing protein [Gammaproteobacteria bacterium]
MTLTYTLWLPALAMAASTLTTHLHMSPDTRVLDNDREGARNALLVPAPLQPEFTPPETTRKNTPAAQSLAGTVTAIGIWERLRAGFNFPQQAAPSVQAHIDIFHNHPRHIEQILQRGEPYLFYILSRVEERGLPAELALLPVIESAFDPFANSPAGAAGIWQFMPATAKHVGLRQDWWVDGRRDIVAATDAALDYLSELHQRFDGDWLLALGAYNAGSARVNRAIRLNRSQGKPVDFWHLPLPEETRGYVPKLIALRAIISNPEAHNITLPVLANTHYFSVVDTGGQLDLQVAARLTGTSMDELQRLNPGLTRSITPPASQHTLLIPRASEQRFRERLARLPSDQRVQSVKYRVRQGDTLSAIAQNSRTTVARLRQINHLESTRIIAGKLLIVPTREPDEDDSTELQVSLLRNQD